jgi:acyl carrier protein
MELQGFINNFAEQFDDIDVSALNGSTIFKDLEEWNSLVALSVIAMVDEEYDVTLKGNDINSANTIEDLYNTVQSKM